MTSMTLRSSSQNSANQNSLWGRGFASEVSLYSFQQCFTFRTGNLRRMEAVRVQDPQFRALE
jgi:hypothetical protein